MLAGIRFRVIFVVIDFGVPLQIVRLWFDDLSRNARASVKTGSRSSGLRSEQAHNSPIPKSRDGRTITGPPCGFACR